MTRHLRTFAAGLAWLAAAASPAVAFDGLDRSVAVVNVSDRGAIWSVEISHVDDPYWGGDLLGAYVIPGGSYVRLEPRSIEGYCLFDMRVTFADGRERIVEAANLCEIDSIAFGDHGYVDVGW